MLKSLKAPSNKSVNASKTDSPKGAFLCENKEFNNG
jgi:hypothetical protein